MVAKTPMDERRAALRFCGVALGWLACLFAWASLLSFHVADPPGTTVWPPPEQPHNWCGAIGAWLAYTAFTWFGIGAYVLLALLHALVIAANRPNRLNDLWLRLLGLLMIGGAVATFGALLWPDAGTYLLTGRGGIVGQVTAAALLPKLQVFGTILLLLLVLVVGFVIAADHLVVAVFRWLLWAGETSAPMLARGGAAMAGAGAAVASGVAHYAGRLASPPPSASPPARRNGQADPARRGAELRAPAAQRAPRLTAPVEEEPTDRGPVLVPAVEPAAARAVPVIRPGAGGATEPGRAPAPSTAAPPRRDPAEEPGEADAPGGAPAQLDVPVNKAVAELAPPPRKAPLPPAPPAGDYKLPAVDLLDRGVPIDKAQLETLCREKAYILEQTLNEFRLACEVVSIETGPVITVFELKLAPGIKGAQIATLSNDLARALKAPAVRVNYPLPGKNTVGVEVPNIDREKVRLLDVLEMSAAHLGHLAIPIFLGKGTAGEPLLADLTRMPHLLIAGTTGSGKSVCVTSIIMSILLTRTPEEVQLILVDPKVVELAAYRDVPHLMCPIVTEPGKAENILEWASTKMDERYALLAEAGVKDIRSYNRLGPAVLRERLQIADDAEMAQIPVKLPYIVIIIDELADLMMMSPKEVEFCLCRIAQKSRAVGIHLIVSTQRPQANVVTGLIKSNLPSRIAFRVSSKLDSRIVLDQNGAELLMGQGDMLFLPPGSSKLVRAQGTFVDDDELKAVVKHAREQRAPQYHPELIRLPGAGAADGGASERDELFDQAVDAILETGRGSVSLLQRRLTIGYGRASRLIDQMYQAGIVGEYKGSQAREVIVTKDEWEAIRRQRDREEAAEQDNGDPPQRDG